MTWSARKYRKKWKYFIELIIIANPRKDKTFRISQVKGGTRSDVYLAWRPVRKPSQELRSIDVGDVTLFSLDRMTQKHWPRPTYQGLGNRQTSNKCPSVVGKTLKREDTNCRDMARTHNHQKINILFGNKIYNAWSVHLAIVPEVEKAEKAPLVLWFFIRVLALRRKSRARKTKDA